MAHESKEILKEYINLREDIAVISVLSRIPEFWYDQPRLWFGQCEAVLASQILDDEAKFNLLLPKLGKEAVEQIGDIVINPPEKNKYETLKSRLLAVYEESESRQFQKLLGGMDLEDQTPSQLLRQMRYLARNKIPDETLGIMWRGYLPASVQTVLAVSEIKDLDNLATVADKIMETKSPMQYREEKCQRGEPDKIPQLISQIDKLKLKVMELKRSRPKYRIDQRKWQRRSTPHAHSIYNPRRRATASDGNRYFHHRHGVTKSVRPCVWRRSQKTK